MRTRSASQTINTYVKRNFYLANPHGNKKAWLILVIKMQSMKCNY